MENSFSALSVENSFSPLCVEKKWAVCPPSTLILPSTFIRHTLSNITFFRLIENTETLERSSRKLDHGRDLLEETESVGASVLSDLEHQREVLTRSRNRVRNKKGAQWA